MCIVCYVRENMHIVWLFHNKRPHHISSQQVGVDDTKYHQLEFQGRPHQKLKETYDCNLKKSALLSRNNRVCRIRHATHKGDPCQVHYTCSCVTRECTGLVTSQMQIVRVTRMTCSWLTRASR